MKPLRLFLSSVQREFASERMGTGTPDIIAHCRRVGMPGSEFTVRDGFVTTIRRPDKVVTGQATGQVAGQAASHDKL